MATKTQKRELMFSLIESWKASGQNQHEFCKANNLAYSGFHYWYKKYREGKASNGPTDFVPVHLGHPGAGNGRPVSELAFPDGRRLSFYQPVEASFLRALLS
jgi:hypothetical protein